jgi:hypothetical protein
MTGDPNPPGPGGTPPIGDLEKWLDARAALGLEQPPSSLRIRLLSMFRPVPSPAVLNEMFDAIAELLVDSRHEPADSAVRGAVGARSYQLVFEMDIAELVLHVEPQASSRVLVHGQVFPLGDAVAEGPVSVGVHDSPEPAMVTDEFGRFTLAMPMDGTLVVAVGGNRIRVPLPRDDAHDD